MCIKLLYVPLDISSTSPETQQPWPNNEIVIIDEQTAPENRQVFVKQLIKARESVSFLWLFLSDG